MSMPRQSFVKCPCCSEQFMPSQVLWIASHHELKDDHLIDEQGDKTEQKRFLPERFTWDCRAIDELGEVCKRNFACPYCHMEIPEDYIRREPMFVSIVGTRGSGKTFFLTALHHRLQQNRFHEDYGLDWSFDAALYAKHDKILSENVGRLFRQHAPPHTVVSLGATMPGDLEKTVTDPVKGAYSVALPVTYILRKEEERQALCFYDHAGGSFVGDNIDEARHVFTHHILNSDILFFLYDPTQNENCLMDYAAREGRQIYRDGQLDVDELVGMESGIVHSDRKIEESSHHVFGAVANFIKQYSDPKNELIKKDQYTKYICIVVTKCDAWQKCLSEKTQLHLQEQPHPNIISDVSSDVEHWLKKHDPAFTTAVQNFAKHYTYIPVSATGRQPKRNNDGTDGYGYDIGISPLNPCWVDVPFLCAMNQQ